MGGMGRDRAGRVGVGGKQHLTGEQGWVLSKTILTGTASIEQFGQTMWGCILFPT